MISMEEPFSWQHFVAIRESQRRVSETFNSVLSSILERAIKSHSRAAVRVARFFLEQNTKTG
jgi:hypothetical protein